MDLLVCFICTVTVYEHIWLCNNALHNVKNYNKMSAALNDLSSAPGAGIGSPNVSQAAVGYFVDQKKGEVNELKMLLKNINVERDVKRKRETIKKVIAYMTLGIDVSRLFTDMIMAIETKDIVIKKMVYLYLCNYAHKEPEMAIMCINSLRRDCDNENPLIRGLALRSLCNLRLESILEYIEQPLKKSLGDISAYVRKTAVIGILKLNSLSPTLVESNGYIAQLYDLLQDPDSNVVTNAIHVINELRMSEGGLQVTQGVVMGLLNRIVEFSEWGLNAVLDLVARYKPTSEDEVFAIMNLLDPLLRTANSGAVLATVKCFVRLTAASPSLHPQVYARAKPPMLTLINGVHSEGQYSMLKHLQVVLQQPAAAGIFDDEYRQFYVRYNEPPHVKHLKVELLPLIANETNARDIATELGEYVTDVDSELAKVAIRSVGRIVAKIPSAAEELTQRLVDLVDVDSAYVRSQAAIVLADVVRIHPAAKHLLLPHLCRWLRKVEDPAAKAALVWVLGEFGGEVLEAPYLLETCIDAYADEASATTKLHLLAAAMKLFFKRPPEMVAMLGRLLGRAVNDNSNQDVHDRALLYYRLLLADVDICRQLFVGEALCAVPTGQFAELTEDELRRRLFEEFNSLAVIYGMPSQRFIKDKFQLQLENAPMSDFDLAVPGLLHPPHEVASSPNPNPAPSPPKGAALVGSVNLLDWSDDLPEAASAGKPSSRLALRDPAVPLSPAGFQKGWAALPDAFSGRVCVLASSFPASAGDYEAQLREEKVLTIASGPLPGGAGVKLFVFAEADVSESPGDLLLLSQPAKETAAVQFLAQLVIQGGGTAGDREVQLTLKHTATSALDLPRRFIDVLLLALSQYSPIPQPLT